MEPTIRGEGRVRGRLHRKIFIVLYPVQSMQITIPFKTPTINHLHGFWRGHVVLKKEAKDLKVKIADIVKAFPLMLVKESPLKVHVDVYEDWYTQDEVVKRKDIANREKFLIDSVFEALEIDDKFIFESSFKKVQSETDEKAVITIEPL
jgi:hypothetical protein